MSMKRQTGAAENGVVVSGGTAAIWSVAAILAATLWIALGVYAALDGDTRGTYCDFGIAATDANFTVDGKPCRIMPGPVFGIYGPIFIWTLLALQLPVLAFFLVRVWRRCIVPQVKIAPLVHAASGERISPRRRKIIRGIVHAYLAATLIAAFNWAGTGVWSALDMNKDAGFCDYYVDRQAANFRIDGDICRLRIGNILGVYGTTFLIVLVGLQSPAYLYFTVLHLRRRPLGNRHGTPQSAA